MIGDLAAGGTPSNLGKIGDTGPYLFYFKVDLYVDLYSQKHWLMLIHLASILMLLSTKLVAWMTVSCLSSSMFHILVTFLRRHPRFERDDYLTVIIPRSFPAI